MIRKPHLLLMFAALVFALMMGTSSITPPTLQKVFAVTTNPSGINLTVSMSHSPNPFVVGQTGQYTIVVSNVGDTDTAGTTTVIDTLPAGFGYVASGSGGNGWSCPVADSPPQPTQQVITCTFAATIISNTATTLLINATTDASAVSSPPKSNSVTLSTPSENNTTDNFASDPTDVRGIPNMAITMTLSDPYTVGVPDTFSLGITNQGTGVATAGTVTVVASVSNGSFLTVTGASGTGWNCQAPSSNAQVTCTNSADIIAFSAAGDITVNVTPNAAGTVTATGTVSAIGDPTSPQSVSNPITIGGTPDLVITKSAGSPPVTPPPNAVFTAGSTGIYTLTVNNQGTGPAAGPIVVTDNLPGGLTLASSTSSTDFTCAGVGSSNVTCTKNTSLPASTPVTIQLTVNVPVGLTGSISNTASVSATSSGESNTGNNTSNTVVVDVVGIDIGVTKTHTGDFRNNQTGTFTITVQNIGSGASAAPTNGNITLVDTLPAGMTFNAGATSGGGWICGVTQTIPNTIVTCTYSGAALNPGGPLNQGDSTVLTFAVDVDRLATTPLTNNVTVSTPGDTATTGNNATSDTVNIIQPDLGIAKTHNNVFAVNTNGDFLITVNNQGTDIAGANTYTVRDTLPAGFNFVSATGTGWSCATAGTPVVVTCTNSQQIAVGGTAPVLTITTMPTSNTANPYVNTVTVTHGRDTNTSNNTATDSVTVANAPSPDLNITKTHTDPCQVGANCVFTINVSNGGLGVTTGPITITDTLPSTFTFVNGGGTGDWAACTASGPVVSCATNPANLTLASGGSLSPLTIRAQPSTNLGSPFNNQVTVNTTGDANAGDNTATDSVNVNASPAPDLTITKTHSSNFTVGNPGSYTITIRNVGVQNLTNQTITVNENLPASFDLQSAGGTGWTCNPATATSAPVPTIICTTTAPVSIAANGGTLADTITVTVIPTQPGTGNCTSAPTVFCNSASVNAATGETNTANNTANDPTTVTTTAASDLTIAKSHTGNFTAGAVGSYNITVTNIGSAAATADVIVTDNLPAGLTFASSSGIGWTCVPSNGNQTVTCTNATDAAAGQPLATLSINVNVATSAAGTVVNSASVSVPADDPNAANNSTTDSTVVSGVADLSITKSHAANFQVGVTGVWTLRVNNVGSTTISGTTTVTDNLPGGITLISGGGGGFSCTGTSSVTCTRTTPFALNSINNDITLNVNVPAGAVGTQSNTATLTNVNDTAGGNNSSTDLTVVSSGAQADLRIVKTHTGSSFTIGSNGTFTLTVTNIGTAATPGGTITVTDVLPNGLTFVSGGGGNFTCSATGQSVTCTNTAGLAQNASSAIGLTVLVGGSPTTLSNTASVSSVAGEPNLADNSSTDTVTTQNAPPASSANSTIGVFPTSIPADGTTTATITVALRDASNNPVANKTVTLSTDAALPSGVNLSSTTGITNASGIATFTVSGNPSSLPVSVSFRATDSDGTLVTNPPAGGSRTLTFTQPVDPTAISTSQSSASANPTSVLADGVAASTITVIIRSNNGNTVPNATVTLTGTPNTGVSVAPSGSQVTNANGQAFFQVRSTVAQTVTFTLQAMKTGDPTPTTLAQQPTVTFTSTTVTGTATTTTTAVTSVPGVLSATNSTLTTDLTCIPADNITTATLTVHLKDGNGSAVANKSVTINQAPILAGVTVQSTSPITNAGGIATFTVRAATQGGPVTFSAAVGAPDNVTLTQTQSITFNAPGTATCVAPSATGVGGTAFALTGTAGGVNPAIGEALLNPPSNGPSLGIVVPFRLRVRAAPRLTGARIGVLKQKTIVVLLGRNSRGTWFLIQLENGQAGWVSAFYIRVTRTAFRHLPIVPDNVDLSKFGSPGNSNTNNPPLVTPTFQPGQGKGTVVGYLVRYRSGPGLNFEQLGLLKSGTVIVLIGKSQDGNWLQFNVEGGGTAWVSAQFITVSDVNGGSLPVVPGS
jgi:uncharacterized repeat protein (TIGR01451 family)